MEKSLITALTDTEEEVIHLLVEIGLKINEARILVIFFRGFEPTSRELERIADLRQPEVSVAITGLSKHNWIGITSLIKGNKGRPIKVFILTKPIDSILDDIKNKISADHDQQAAMLQRIRDLIGKPVRFYQNFSRYSNPPCPSGS